MPDSRQQRAAREWNATKAAVLPRLNARVRSACTARDLWLAYRDLALVAGVPADAMPIMEQAFYAGASTVFDLLMRVALDDGNGEEKVQRLADEFSAFTQRRSPE